jgi:hypothetical protein
VSSKARREIANAPHDAALPGHCDHEDTLVRAFFV